MKIVQASECFYLACRVETSNTLKYFNKLHFAPTMNFGILIRECKIAAPAEAIVDQNLDLQIEG